MKLLLTFLLGLTFLWSFAQSPNRDSLISALSTETSDSIRLNNLVFISNTCATFEEFFVYQKQGLQLAKKIGNNKAIIDLKLNEASRYFDAQEDDKGMKIMMDQLSEAEKQNDSSSISRINYALGVHFFYKMDVDNSVKHMENSVQFYPSSTNPLGKATYMMALGVVLQNTTRTEESIRYQLQAIKIKEDNG